jgi:O-antigen/teichoic acid export membrane protein
MAQVSFSVVIAQQVASFRERKPEIAGEVAAFCYTITFALGSMLAAGLFLGREWISYHIFREAQLTGGLGAAALALPFVAAASLQQGLFGGLERFREQAIISVALVPVVIGLPVFGALHGGLEGAALGLAGAYILRFALSQVVVVHLFRKAGLRWIWAGFRSKLGLIWKLALPATLSSILVALAVWGGQTLLVRNAGGSTELGMFAAAYMVKTMVLFAPSQMVVALLPILSRVHAIPSTNNPGNLTWINTAATLVLTVALAGAGIAAAPFVMGLFGQGFMQGSDILAILLASAPIEAVTISLYQDIQAKGRFWTGLMSVTVPLTGTVILFALLAIGKWQGEGLAAAWLAGWSIAFVGTLATRSTLQRPSHPSAA